MRVIIIIMQDDGIHANLRYTQQAYAATVMKVTHATFVQFPHSYCVVFQIIIFFAFSVTTFIMGVQVEFFDAV